MSKKQQIGIIYRQQLVIQNQTSW